MCFFARVVSFLVVVMYRCVVVGDDVFGLHTHTHTVFRFAYVLECADVLAFGGWLVFIVVKMRAESCENRKEFRNSV